MAAIGRPRQHARGRPLRHHAVAGHGRAQARPRLDAARPQPPAVHRLPRQGRRAAGPRPARPGLPRHRHQPGQRAGQAGIQARARCQQRRHRHAEHPGLDRQHPCRLAPQPALVAERPRRRQVAARPVRGRRGRPIPGRAGRRPGGLRPERALGSRPAGRGPVRPARCAPACGGRRGRLPAEDQPVAVGRRQRHRLCRRCRPGGLRVHPPGRLHPPALQVRRDPVPAPRPEVNRSLPR